MLYVFSRGGERREGRGGKERERERGGDSVGWSLGRNVTCPWRMKA